MSAGEEAWHPVTLFRVSCFRVLSFRGHFCGGPSETPEHLSHPAYYTLYTPRLSSFSRCVGSSKKRPHGRKATLAMDMNNVSRIFQTFMARVVALEEMTKRSSQTLAIFQQELETFRRSPLNNSSVFAQVLASAPSERLEEYQEAGYRHCHTDHAVVVKLDNALKDLQNHVQQARAIMEEIQRLLYEANGIMHEDLSTRLANIVLTDGAGASETAPTADIGQGGNFPQRADTGQRAGGHEPHSSTQVTSPKTKVRQLFAPDYVTTMAAIYGMLQQDFTMQERVVGTLGLDLSSELLQNYHMMWTLQPFVDESVVEEALSWTRPFTG